MVKKEIKLFDLLECYFDEDNNFIEDSDLISEEIDLLLYNISQSKYNNYPCVIFGSLGLWDGRKEIMPVKEYNLVKAIKRCIRDKNIEDFKIYQVDGHIKVEAIHHDGNNIFYIHILNNKGINCKNGDLSKKCYHKSINGYLY